MKDIYIIAVDRSNFMKIGPYTIDTNKPEIVTLGTNEFVGTNLKNLVASLNNIISQNWKKGTIPLLWDGNATKRIADIIVNL
jgi:UDP-N-acetylglucosamine 2-epimerase (non-hydrolysing)